MVKYIAFITGIFSISLASGQAPTTVQLDAGKKVYSKSCLSCHMANGAGVPGLNPPLFKTDWVTGDKKRLIKVILKGLEDPITIQGDEYVNAMPAQPHLTDKEIADVLTYIRASFGNKATLVTTTEVAGQRAKLIGVKPK